VHRRAPEAQESEPLPEIQDAIVRIRAVLEGGKDDLTSIALDMSDVPPFHRKVFEVTRAIPPGQTLTYGDVAARVGEPGAAQAVGQALGANPFAPVVPCHRVLAAGGKMNGFSAHGGIVTKRRMLEIEGAIAHQPSLFGDLD
jgi:methylated-DNA-[protein]-cysteine S-methyltransferase